MKHPPMRNQKMYWTWKKIVPWVHLKKKHGQIPERWIFCRRPYCF